MIKLIKTWCKNAGNAPSVKIKILIILIIIFGETVEIKTKIPKSKLLISFSIDSSLKNLIPNLFTINVDIFVKYINNNIKNEGVLNLK